MSRLSLRLALLPVAVLALGSCRDVPTAPVELDQAALLSGSSTLPQVIDATIQQIFPNGHRASVESRWRNVTTKLDAKQTKVAFQMLTDLADWIEKKTSDITPPAGETKGHAAARLVLYMSMYAYRDPSQPMPAIPELGSDAVLKIVTPTAAATAVTPDGKAGIAFPKGAVTEPTVLVIYADAEQSRPSCAGPLDTELCQYTGYYHIEAFPHQRLTAPARVGICGPELAPARLRIAHGLPAAADRIDGATVTDGIEILPAVSVADFLPCGIGGLTVSFSEFDPVDPVPQHSRYCPTETERTLTYADLESAIANAPESNVVVVCDGTWPANEANVDKAITIRSETPGGATLEQPSDATASQAVLRVNGIESGQVRIADLSIQFKWAGIRATGTFDQVVLDSVRLTGPGPIAVTVGLQLEGSSVATAHALVTRSRFMQSYYGVRQAEPVAVDTYDSHFENIGWAGLILWSAPRTNQNPTAITAQTMQKADVVGNVFVNIPSLSTGAAVSIQAAGDHLIQNNQFTNTQSGPGTASGSSSVFITRTLVAAANTRPVRIRDNVVVGHGAVGDPVLATSWGVGSAFRITSGIAGVSDSVTHNSATGAYIGLDAVGSEVTAFDNSFAGVYIGLRKFGTADVSITRNDFTGYTFPITTIATPLPGNPTLSNGSVACNWWGSAAAPAPLGPNVNPGGYMPFATEAVANTEVECSVNTDSPPVVRMCPTVSGSVPTVPTLSQAIQLVAAGGTVKVCDGTHSVFNFALNAKSVTIEGEGPGIPTLDGGGNEQIFRLGSPTSNTAIVLRKLRLQNASNNDVNVGQNYGSLLIDQVAFHPAHGGQPNGHADGVGVFQATGSGITIENSTFDGGDIGVEVNNSPGVIVRNNSFANHSNLAIGAGSGSGMTISGNTISNCGPNWCVQASNGPNQGSGGTFKILDNTINIDFAKRTEFAFNLHQANLEMSGNVITGTGGTRDPNDPSTWPMRWAIWAGEQATITVNANQISGAWASMGMAGVVGTGRDNVISNVGRGFDGLDGVSITRSDITNYSLAFARGTPSASLLRCNWWGSSSGPTNLQAGVDPAIYIPWATAPIANTQTACDPNAPAPAVVRACATPGNGPEPTLSTIPAAIALVAPGGTVKVCDGTYVVPETNLSAKSLTVEGEGPGVPTIESVGNGMVFHLGIVPGNTAIVLRKLRFQHSSPDAVDANQPGASLLIDQVEFRPTHAAIPNAAAIRTGAGTVTVLNSTFIGGDIGIQVDRLANVVVNASVFSGQRNLAIAGSSSSTITASNNTISDCLGHWCVQMSNGTDQGSGGTMRLLNNTITVDFAHPLWQAMNLHEANFEIVGNVITGTGGSRDPNDMNTWPMHAAVSINEPSTVIFNGNHIQGANSGFGFDGGVQGTGRDNVISFVNQAAGAIDGVVITRSNFTNYVTPIGNNGSGHMRCNWWGTPLGPQNLYGHISASMYSPWETTPIAGTASACDPNAPPPAVVRVCGTIGAGTYPTVATVAAAIPVVAAGGTVKVCDGTHVVRNVSISAKSMTIEGEGPGVPTLDAQGTPQVFIMDSLSQTPITTSVVLRKLKLVNAGHTGIAIGHRFGQLLVDQVEFHPTHGPIGNFTENLAYNAGIIAFDAVGQGLTVQNSTFIGGDIGVLQSNTTNVVIRNNAFSGHLNAAIHGGNGGTIEAANNTITDCGPRWCLFVGSTGAGSYRLVGNSITTDMAHQVRDAIVLGSGTYHIEGNVVNGVGGSRSPDDRATWPITSNGIAVTGAVTVIGNEVSGANNGLMFGGATGTATDNIVRDADSPINVDNSIPGTNMAVHRNDFYNFYKPIATDFSVSSVTCNWWGTAAGPVMPQSITPSLYTPWATTPIAKQPGVVCTP